MIIENLKRSVVCVGCSSCVDMFYTKQWWLGVMKQLINDRMNWIESIDWKSIVEMINDNCENGKRIIIISE